MALGKAFFPSVGLSFLPLMSCMRIIMEIIASHGTIAKLFAHLGVPCHQDRPFPLGPQACPSPEHLTAGTDMGEVCPLSQSESSSIGDP